MQQSDAAGCPPRLTQAREEGAEHDDYHPSFQTIAFLMEETGECGEQELNHSDEEAERFYRDLQQRGIRVRVGMEATGYSRWFERLLAELGFEVWIGDPAQIKAKRMKKQKTDREDARLLLRLMMLGCGQQASQRTELTGKVNFSGTENGTEWPIPEWRKARLNPLK